MLVEMIVESVRVNLQNYQRVVVLKEKSSERYLPIWIGNNEADAIVIQLQNVPVPRPQTHDLLKTIINEMAAKVSRIVVSDLSEEVFYARINLEVNGKVVEIDSRPSDAIALAVRLKAPIFAEDTVLEKAGVNLDGAQESESADVEKTPEEREAEAQKLSAFREFIDTLDIDDMGKAEKS